MSEMEHPPIEFGPSVPVSLELKFAEKAVQALALFNVSDTELFEMPRSEHCELLGTDGAEYALRVVANQVYAHEIASKQNSIYPSNEYLVVELQIGLAKETQDETTFGEYAWQDYVATVIDKQNPDNAWVLDKKTGKDLEEMDLVVALEVLEHLSQELRGFFYEDYVRGEETEENYLPLVAREDVCRFPRLH